MADTPGAAQRSSLGRPVDAMATKTQMHMISRCTRLSGMVPKITRINPDQLHKPPGYHHITVVGPGRTAFLAGQCPLDVSGTLVGPGDIDAQIDMIASN